MAQTINKYQILHFNTYLLSTILRNIKQQVVETFIHKFNAFLKSSIWAVLVVTITFIVVVVVAVVVVVVIVEFPYI